MSGENVKTLDEPLFEFLTEMENDPEFGDTDIILHSDHGMFFF